MTYQIHNVNSFDWLDKCKPNSFHAIVTDPPYGVVEFKNAHLEKMDNGKGGIWRLPPKLNGCERSPLPRFTVLTKDEIEELREFYFRLGSLSKRILVPGAHLFIATNVLLSHEVAYQLSEAGLENRGTIVRLVRTLRGGDRPKNAENEFPEISVLPRGCWEPWLIYRKPCEGKVSDNLRKWGTGGLRRISKDIPFADVIKSRPTPKGEKDIAPHPTLKPQDFLRQMCRAALPLRKGVLLDPFMGSGSTIAACEAIGIDSVGLELSEKYFEMAKTAIEKLKLIVTENSTLHDYAQIPLPQIDFSQEMGNEQAGAGT